ncbi:MAG: hypothetical protein LBD67_08230 [Candidatus Accumulibacter sp.]|jgi:hypothetical protein|nr:hypothetical protein [Accumulibacter sp.]
MNALGTVAAFVTGLSPWRIIGVLLVIAALLAVGAFGGHAMARNHYEPLLADANKQIGTLTTANTGLRASVERQNNAVAALVAQANQREQDAAQAVAAARSQSAKNQTRAQAVLIAKPPAGQSACEAAQKAFDDELRTERGTR